MSNQLATVGQKKSLLIGSKVVGGGRQDRRQMITLAHFLVLLEDLFICLPDYDNIFSHFLSLSTVRCLSVVMQ